MNRGRSVVSALFLLAFITIVDRVCISAAKNDISRDLRISDVSFGVGFGAFALGYSLAMVTSGWVADVLGPRRFLAWIVCLWSLLTGLTGLMHTLLILIGVRLLFGAAEAGVFPTAARAIYTYLPVQRRGFALGLLNTGSRLGAAVRLAFTSACVVRIGWRWTFILLAMSGMAWAIGRARTATLSGMMNTVGSLGSFSSSICFPWLSKITGDAKTFFLVAAALNVLAVFCWWRVRVENPLNAKTPASSDRYELMMPFRTA